MRRSTHALLIGAPVALALAPTSWAGTVYNSFTGGTAANAILIIADPDESNSRVELPGLPMEREFDSQIGDSITLAGTDRFVTSFTVRVAAFTPTTFGAATDVELTLYTNSGGFPGTLLWNGTIAGISMPTSSAYNVTYNPNITVPTNMVFSVALSNISNAGHRPLGIVSSATSSVGTSGMDVLVQDTATQVWRKEFYPQGFQNIQAMVVAVPAPGAGAFLATAALLIARRRR